MNCRIKTPISGGFDVLILLRGRSIIREIGLLGLIRSDVASKIARRSFRGKQIDNRPYRVLRVGLP